MRHGTVVVLLLGLMLAPVQAAAQTILKGPYLQTVTPTSIKIFWETDMATSASVYFGLASPDEATVADPQVGTVPEIVRKAGKVDVITPFGLEVLHLTDREPDAPNPHILGPRRFVQVQPHYAKPCIVRNPTKLSRGGHFADSDTLAMPDGLYLLHMKYCDAALYADTMNRRNATVSNIRASEGQRIMIGRHWFPEARKDDATFQGFQARPQVDGFDFSQHKAAMQASWQPRETTGFYQFDRPDPQEVYTLPERFFGIL